ncbi:NUDIX hydrolase [Bradyrhizobium uaiense]|uniref:NUDIX hydrolase n=1 Tax=Bradyrhizobium uaiense TaxID=2594946 RepID=A0A6P1BL80_9BRAD|nr:NUDIX hydrolase [Bradyrhizobium uaiense]NEU99108.1 NUDIX hydrolase [Bradyrhizobium uaiense]
MARTPVLAAGGIVLRRETPPRFAVVRLRKRNEWVLPKGKLDDDETARDAAEREVLEETGHDVEVHEFLGTLVYDSGGRSKVVHYWRMDAGGKPVRALMSDIREVDWLPLDAALERLSRSYERTFLENVGPIALQAAANAERRRSRLAADEPVADAPETVDTPAIAELPVAADAPVDADASEVAEATGAEVIGLTELTGDAETPVVVDAKAPAEVPVVADTTDLAEMPAADGEPDQPVMAPEPGAADDGQVVVTARAVEAIASAAAPSSAREGEPDATAAQPIPRKNLIERVRDWLRRAA